MIINITKMYQSNPRLIEWLTKSKTSNPKPIQTTAVNPISFINLDNSIEITLIDPESEKE